VVLLTCSYRDNEFVRIGYYVNNEYTDPELNENPPAQPIFQKVIELLVLQLVKHLLLRMPYQVNT